METFQCSNFCCPKRRFWDLEASCGAPVPCGRCPQCPRLSCPKATLSMRRTDLIGPRNGKNRLFQSKKNRLLFCFAGGWTIFLQQETWNLCREQRWLTRTFVWGMWAYLSYTSLQTLLSVWILYIMIRFDMVWWCWWEWWLTTPTAFFSPSNLNKFERISSHTSAAARWKSCLFPQSSPTSVSLVGADRRDWHRWHHSEWGRSDWPRPNLLMKRCLNWLRERNDATAVAQDLNSIQDKTSILIVILFSAPIEEAQNRLSDTIIWACSISAMIEVSVGYHLFTSKILQDMSILSCEQALSLQLLPLAWPPPHHKHIRTSQSCELPVPQGEPRLGFKNSGETTRNTTRKPSESTNLHARKGSIWSFCKFLNKKMSLRTRLISFIRTMSPKSPQAVSWWQLRVTDPWSMRWLSSRPPSTWVTIL